MRWLFNEPASGRPSWYTHLFVYLQSTSAVQHYCYCCYYILRRSRNRNGAHRLVHHNKWVSTPHLTRAVVRYKCQKERKKNRKTKQQQSRDHSWECVIIELSCSVSFLQILLSLARSCDRIQIPECEWMRQRRREKSKLKSTLEWQSIDFEEFTFGESPAIQNAGHTHLISHFLFCCGHDAQNVNGIQMNITF